MIPNQIKSALILVMIGIMQIANHAVMSQEVALKSGLVIEKRILKGTNLIASAGNPRGILQWQQSTNISTWTDLQDQTRNQLTIPITSTVYLRCAIKETNCDLIYSDVLKVTPFDQPIVSTKAVTGITEIAALSGGNVISEENSPILARGVCWAKTRNPTTGNSVTTDGLGIGDFNSVITGLDGNTVYYVRAYASNIVGTSYGAEVTFKTTASLATVTTAGITGITRISAESGGTVTNDGNAAVTARGVCWSVTQIPTIANNKTTDGTGTGPFTSSITGLTGNQNYFVRAYATNEAGTSYGNEISFRTGALLPVVSTTLVTSITQTSASSGGNVTSDGGANVSTRGVCWAITQNPTTDNFKSEVGSGLGIFSVNLLELLPNTVYYVKAFAINSSGTGYGDQVSFKTNPGLPTVSTLAVANDNENTASGGGNITNDGGINITARGVCWSTISNPTTADSKSNDGGGAGVFTSSLTGLAYNTVYFVRAYATNGVGTSYGDQVQFRSGTFDYDGRAYNFKKIGTQIWMTENLAYLPSVSASTVGSDNLPFYYVYGNSSSTVSVAKATAEYMTYGVLYNWEAAKIACPTGWHLPTDEEWTILTGFLGSPAGGKMKGTTLWTAPNTGANNESGFNALPGGNLFDGVGFNNLGSEAYFWSSTSYNSVDTWFRGLYYNDEDVVRYHDNRSYGFSVRCVKD